MILAASWVFRNEPFLHWVVQEILGSIVSFVLVGLVLTTAWRSGKRRIGKWLDPTTPGGLGDAPDQYGTPLHMRIKSAHPPGE